MHVKDIHSLNNEFGVVDLSEEKGCPKLITHYELKSAGWMGRGLKMLGYPSSHSPSAKVAAYLKQNPLLPYSCDRAEFESAEKGLNTYKSKLSNPDEIASIDYVISRLSVQKKQVVNGQKAYAEMKARIAQNPNTAFIEELQKEKEQDNRFEICIQMALDKDGLNIVDCYETLSLSNSQLFELLKIESSSGHPNKGNLSEKTFEIPLTNEQKYELALLNAASESKMLTSWIHLLNLTNEQRFEVAKKATSSYIFLRSFDKFENFSNFELTSEQRYVVASLLLTNHKFVVIENIEKFNLDAEQKLTFAKTATTLNIARNLRYADLDYQSNSTRDADYKSAKEVFKHIELFDLERLSQSERFEFTMNAYWDPNGVDYIFSLNLTAAQEWRFAQELAHSGACNTYIKKFKSLNQDQRFELARIEAASNPQEGKLYPKAHFRQHPYTIGIEKNLGGLSKNIKDYELSEPQREKVALVVFDPDLNHHYNTHRAYLSNYELNNLEIIKKFISKCFNRKPEAFFSLVPSYGICKPQVLKFLWSRFNANKQLPIPEPILSIYEYNEFFPKKNLLLNSKIQKDFPEIFLLHGDPQPQIPEAVTYLETDLPQLSAIITQIKAIKDDFLRDQQLKWLGHIAFFIKGGEIAPEIVESHLADFQQMISLRLPEMRLYLTHILLDQLSLENKEKMERDEALRLPNPFANTLINLFSSSLPGWFVSSAKWMKGRVTGYPDALQMSTTTERQLNFRELGEQFKDKAHTKLFRLALLPVYQTGSDWSSIIESLNSSEFKDSARMRIALNFLRSLNEITSLSLVDKKNLLDYVFKLPLEGTNKEKIKLLCYHFQKIETAFKLGLDAQLKIAATMSEVDKLLEQKISATFNIHDIPDLVEKYLAIQQRYPNALLIYAAKLSIPYIKSLFSSVVRAVINDNGGNKVFHQLRRHFEPGSHLATVFDGREELKNKWQKGEILPLLDLMPQNADLQAAPFDVQGYLKARVCDFKHIDPKEYVFLDTCLKAPENREAILVELKVTQQGLKDSLKAANPKDRGLIGKQIKQLQFQQDLMMLLDPDSVSEEKLNQLETKILPSLASLNLKNSDFSADLEGLKSNLKPVRMNLSFENWTVVDSDDWQDLLLSGTEVIGSCQNINSPFNPCLTNTLLDDKIRVIVIKNNRGTLAARVILRLLYDETAKQPVLFKEIMYANNEISQQIASNVINQMCIRRAKSLGLTLTAKSGNVGDYANSLRSFGSRSNEYVDADRLSVTQGNYSISNERLVVLYREGVGPD